MTLAGDVSIGSANTHTLQRVRTQAYMDYFAGKLEDHAYSEDEVAMALAGLPTVAA